MRRLVLPALCWLPLAACFATGSSSYVAGSSTDPDLEAAIEIGKVLSDGNSEYCYRFRSPTDSLEGEKIVCLFRVWPGQKCVLPSGASSYEPSLAIDQARYVVASTYPLKVEIQVQCHEWGNMVYDSASRSLACQPISTAK